MSGRQTASVSEKVLESVRFLEDDQKWNGAVEKVQRTFLFENGESKTYVDVRIRIGTRWLVLPRHGLDEVAGAIQSAKGISSVHREVPPSAGEVVDKQKVAPRRRLMEVNRRQPRRFEEFEE